MSQRKIARRLRHSVTQPADRNPDDEAQTRLDLGGDAGRARERGEGAHEKAGSRTEALTDQSPWHGKQR
jgi:hypothetical protein